MRERFAEPLSLRALADIAILSPFHFDRVFRDVTGMPPGRFLSALRMEAAKRLLLTTRLRITDVCFEVGYASLGTFTTQFKQTVGISPRQLRRMSREIGSARLDSVYEVSSKKAAPALRAGVLRGRIEVDDDFRGLSYIALYPTSVPHGRPMACAVAPVPGSFEVAGVADGLYHLMTVAFPESEEVLRSLLPEAARDRIGIAPGPIIVAGHNCSGPVEIVLRPIRVTDPPVLPAVPLLSGGAEDGLGSGPPRGLLPAPRRLRSIPQLREAGEPRAEQVASGSRRWDRVR